MEQKKYIKAIKYLRKYLKNSLAKQYREALYYLAGCFYNCRDFNEANALLIRYIKKYQEIKDDQIRLAFLLLADIKLKLNEEYYKKTGRNNSNFLKSAERSLLKTESKGIDRPELWFKLATIYRYLKRFKKSKMLFHKLHNKFPKNIRIILSLSEIHIIENNLEEAKLLLRKAIEIDNNYQNTWNLMCILCEKKEDLPEFFQACKNSLRSGQTKEQKKFAFNNFGSYYFKKEDYYCALYFFNRALKIDKLFKNSIDGKVRALFELRLLDLLLKFTANIEVSEDNASIIALKALTLSEKGDYKIALDLISEIIKKISAKNPFIANLYAIEGEIYKKQEEILKAIESYQKSLIVEGSSIKDDVMSKLKECEQILNANIKKEE